MRYQVDVDKPTADYLRHLSPLPKQKIKASMDTIADTPHLGKLLQRELSGLYSYRVGRYRIVYAIDEHRKEVNIVAIGPRETIYETLASAKKKNQ